MTKDEVIRLTVEAGLWDILDVTKGAGPAEILASLERFANLVAAHAAERICKAIKDADDYCVTKGDYMLDSDDCIAVAKGEWVQPECSTNPDAPHGFDRNGSHNNGRYTCDCEGWVAQPAAVTVNMSSIAQYKLDELVKQGYVVNGFAIERRDGDLVSRGFITEGGMVCWWRDRDDEPMGVVEAAQPEQPTASIDSLVTEFEAMPGGMDAMEKGRQWVSSLEQEPVAWQWLDAGVFRKRLPATSEPEAWHPLYTSPPQRPWVGLTEDEATFLWETTHNNDSWELIKRVEAKLKEKNT